MPTLNIRCGKANEAWLINALSADTEIPLSKIIDLAVQYHDLTGEFMQLGTVSIKEENPQCVQKRFYFRKNSPIWDIVKREKELHFRFPKTFTSDV